MNHSPPEVATVAVVTGHLFRASEMSSAVQEAVERGIRGPAEAILARRRVGRLDSALACGSDIVVAEAALDAGIPLHVVLPFPFDPFAALSIDIGDPPGREGSWRGRAENILSRAASLTLAAEEAPPSHERDGYFHHGFRFMAGLALIHAYADGGECRLIAVTDGAAAAGLAGANRATADWRRTGRPVDHIAFPFERPPPRKSAVSVSPFRPVVLMWLPRGHEAAESGDALSVEFMSPEGNRGRAAVTRTPAEALALAARFAQEAACVVCAIAPVTGAGGLPRVEEIDRLVARVAPQVGDAGAPLATLSFAAEAILEVPDAFSRFWMPPVAVVGDPPATSTLFRVGMRPG